MLIFSLYERDEEKGTVDERKKRVNCTGGEKRKTTPFRPSEGSDFNLPYRLSINEMTACRKTHSPPSTYFKVRKSYGVSPQAKAYAKGR